MILIDLSSAPGSWKRTSKSPGAKALLPAPTPRGQGHRKENGLSSDLCASRQGPGQHKYFGLPGLGSPWLAPKGEGQTPPGTDTPSGFAFPPASSFSDFITSHLPFIHQCESQGHSWFVRLAPQKPVVLGSLQASRPLVAPVLVQFL